MLAAPILIAPHVYARNLSANQRYNDGFNDGYQAGLSDRQSGNQYNYSCDPQGLHTSDGQHTIFYCNGWAAGYRSGYGVIYQPRPTGPNWTGICNTIQPILVESCGQLVNPDGSLTVPDGKKAYTCI
jgi:hypothetical protein